MKNLLVPSAPLSSPLRTFLSASSSDSSDSDPGLPLLPQPDFACKLTQNEADSPKERLRKAKEWLAEHPEEKQSTASTIFNVNRRTLNNSITRKTDRKRMGGYNIVMTESMTSAIHIFIENYLTRILNPTRGIVFGAIKQLIREKGGKEPTERWFTS